MSEEEAFKVTDRRRRAEEDAPAQTPAQPVVAPTSPPAPSRIASSATAPPPDPAPGAPDLQGLFVMFASSALIGLGAAADPMTGEQRVDLEQAQEAIETLLLLKVKTEGNRTEPETRLLDQILHDLQMRFVRMAQGSGLPPR